MTREEKKFRLIINNMTAEELRQCIGILKLAKDAGLEPNEALDVLIEQGIFKF